MSLLSQLLVWCRRFECQLLASPLHLYIHLSEHGDAQQILVILILALDLVWLQHKSNILAYYREDAKDEEAHKEARQAQPKEVLCSLVI